MTGTPGTPGFDPRKFAHETRLFAEAHAIEDEHLENRVIRIEEIIAARWPRSWLLRRRLAKEIRASVAGYDDDYIPRGDFRARRSETTWQQIGGDPPLAAVVPCCAPAAAAARLNQDSSRSGPDPSGGR